MTRRRSATTAPSWRTIGEMDQARYKRTARLHHDTLPAHLARIADMDTVGSNLAAELMKHCSDHQLTIARAGRH